MLKAVLSNLVGEAGMFLQNLSMAWSTPFFVASAYQSELWFDACLLNRMRIANATL